MKTWVGLSLRGAVCAPKPRSVLAAWGLLRGVYTEQSECAVQKLPTGIGLCRLFNERQT